mmetsp:Transcript_2247/g.3633  ORF Transcript_2247/g.3633 Transcript_2247/m.3633 type:complete len:147 (+) Transcript_2247:33-473(+)
MSEDKVTLVGGCHCQSVRFEVQVPGPQGLVHLVAWDCNCSICKMKRNVHFVVPEACFKLVKGSEEGQITTYTYNTKVAKHCFCATCGVQSYYRPRSNPDGFAVTLHCLDEPGLGDQPQYTYEIRPFNGQNWEEFVEGSGIRDMSKP